MKYSRAGFPMPETLAPWGGLGTPVADAQDSAQAAAMAGLDWRVCVSQDIFCTYSFVDEYLRCSATPGGCPTYDTSSF